eukprot:Em0018g1200a
MRRHLANQDLTDGDGSLTEKWIVPSASPAIANKKGSIEVSESFMNFEDLSRFGRFSFKGFNKEVEIMARAEERDEDSGEENEEEGVSVSAKEMAERYSTLTDSSHILGKRRRGEVHPTNARKRSVPDSSGFLKPM